MSEAEEAKAAHFAIELFACLTESLAPALREFLASKSLHPHNSVIDAYQYNIWRLPIKAATASATERCPKF